MESLYLIKCHKILDHHKVEVHAEIADFFLIGTHSADSIKQEQLKILMFVISGDKDILKDNV
jgi:hypothetical protein